MRFNEAAGIPRGRRPWNGARSKPVPASMRPRVFPAEDGAPARELGPHAKSFNEAAGIPRGRLTSRGES